MKLMKKNTVFTIVLLFCLSLVVFAGEKPKIAFIILEENIEKKSTTVTETKFKAVFQDKGFIVSESVFKEGLSDKNYPDDNEKIKSLIKDLDAGTVVIGRAVVTEVRDKENNIVSYSADISANAFKTNDMKVLGSSKGQAESLNADPIAAGAEALEKASVTIAGNLADQILQKLASKIQD